ncbi:MAG: PKD domain-containing protein [Candidatus Thermoplasmatota archaeon]
MRKLAVIVLVLLLPGCIEFEKKNISPTAKIDVDNTKVYTNQTINFSAKGSHDVDGKIKSYSWSFGDGYYSDLKEVEHRYSKPGKYTVLLTVKDNRGGKNTTFVIIEVLNRAPVPIMNELKGYYTMDILEFNASSSYDPDGEITSYEWNFGDFPSPYAYGKVVEHKYRKPGIYNVSLVVIDDKDERAKTTMNVTILNRKPIAYAGKDITAYPNEIIQFNGSGEDLDGIISMYEWDFDGDGKYDWKSRTTGYTTHFYTTPGNYTAMLKVTDDFGDSGTATIKLKIIAKDETSPIGYAGIDQKVGIGKVNFVYSGYDFDGYITIYEFDFDGDGKYELSTNSDGVANFTYTKPGLYNATLRVKDDSGKIGIDTAKITVLNERIEHELDCNVFVDWNNTYNYRFNITGVFEKRFLKANVGNVGFKYELLSYGNGIKNDTISPRILPENGKKTIVELYIDDSEFIYTIGGRVIDAVNESIENLNLRKRYLAKYSFSQNYTKNRNETINYTTIGFMDVKRNGHMVKVLIEGEGNVYIERFVQGKKVKLDIVATNMVFSELYNRGTKVSTSMSWSGYGKMWLYDGEGGVFDMDIEETRYGREDKNTTEDYNYAKGKYENANRGISADVIYKHELIGRGNKENFVGIVYETDILQIEYTSKGTWNGIPFDLYNKTTSWNVVDNPDEDLYENETIYFEYYQVFETSFIKNVSKGEIYPENAPTKKIPELSIFKVSEVKGLKPRVIKRGDKIVLSSDYGYKIEFKGGESGVKKLVGKEYNCFELLGNVISGGEGTINSWHILDFPNTGLLMEGKSMLEWNGERLEAEYALYTID